jgi:hypothetical protein
MHDIRHLERLTLPKRVLRLMTMRALQGVFVRNMKEYEAMKKVSIKVNGIKYKTWRINIRDGSIYLDMLEGDKVKDVICLGVHPEVTAVSVSPSIQNVLDKAQELTLAVLGM